MVEEGGSSMSTSKSKRDTSSIEEQPNSTSSERQQIVLLKEGVHNLQNAPSTIKEVKNLGNKQMATRTPD
jgi:hypothetical protein